MPRQRRDAAVEEGAAEAPEEQTQPRRRGRRPAAEGEAQAQVDAAAATPGDVARQERPRVHADLLTVAFRGPLAIRFRELAEQHHLSLARLVKDAVLAYEVNVAAGYQPGTALAEWKAQQAPGSQGD
jgi:hypothetical protein